MTSRRIHTPHYPFVYFLCWSNSWATIAVDDFFRQAGDRPSCFQGALGGEDPRWGTNPSSHTKNVDSFEAPPFNLFAPFHLNDVLVRQGERERCNSAKGRGKRKVQGGGGILTPHHRVLGNHLVGGLCDTFYQFFMPIPLDVTPLRAFYAPDSSAQENMLPLW